MPWEAIVLTILETSFNSGKNLVVVYRAIMFVPMIDPITCYSVSSSMSSLKQLVS